MGEFLPVEPFDLIIFGASGDLALRKLLPALYQRDGDGQLPPSARIIGIGRSTMTTEKYVQTLHDALTRALPNGLDETTWSTFANRIIYLDFDATDSGSSQWPVLAQLLSNSQNHVRAAYLSTSPKLYGAITAGLHEHNIITPTMRLVLEKPIGIDEVSANAVNDAVGKFVDENQIFRIDHYLGKETVQNLLALRFGNALFEPLWRREVIDHVQISVAEDLGLENRVSYYDHIGALKDMVQNHLLQLVCLVAMEPPSSLDVDAVRAEKIKVLKALKPIGPESVQQNTVRGQYQAGAIDGNAVPSYADDLGHQSDTETYTAIKLEVDNWRWSGVPFYLRTGKRMPTKRSDIIIQFKRIPHSIFDQTNLLEPNRLTISLQPDEGVTLTTMVKRPGPGGFDLEAKDLDLSFEEAFGAQYQNAYERLIIEVLRGIPTLFMHRDEVSCAWQWIDAISAGWQATGQSVDPYVAGSWGPHTASNLLDRDMRSWLSEKRL